MTDIFENIYIRSAGPEMYDQLARHEIPWTDQSVKDALTIMAEHRRRLEQHGRRDGGRASDRDAGVRREGVQRPARGRHGRHRRLRAGDHGRRTLEPETGFNVFTFPSIEGSGPTVVGGGDLFVQFKDSPAADAFLEYLTTPEAAEIWAARGGFSSPNKNLDTSVYPDEITRVTAGALGEAETFRFDISDLQPSAFGGTPGQGLFKALHGLRREPGRHRRDHAADGGRRDEGVRLESKRLDERMSESAQTAEAPPRELPPLGEGPGFWQRYGTTLLFLGPRSCSLVSGSSTRRSARSSGASTTEAATSSSGSTTTRRSSATTRSSRRSRTTSSGSSSCRRSSPRSGSSSPSSSSASASRSRSRWRCSCRWRSRSSPRA